MKKQGLSKKFNYILNDDEEINIDNSDTNDNTAQADSQKAANSCNLSAAESSVIGVNAKIKGELSLSENLQVLGEIEGNIFTRANIKISGVVTGNIEAVNVSVDCGTVTGSITSSADVFISEKSVVTGDIKAVNVIAAGTVTGNIDAEQTVTLKAGCNVTGDINACALSVSEGAKIDGTLKIG